MKQILLDTSFIITAVKNKIDFFEELEEQGFKITIPKQVIKELQGLNSETALKLLKNSKSKFKATDLKVKNTDNGIIRFAKQNPESIIATLDRQIKKQVPNQKMVIRRKRKLGIV
jgi:rRNA-processing protein FCF1